jgi:hypothetical protein
VYSGNVTADDIFDRKLWDGSDFFFVWPAPRFIFVHERVIRALVAESISGWTAARPDAVKFGDTLTPGNLEMWLPPERILDVRLNYSEEYWEFFE